ncbi:MAG TPA: LysR family transcriptional regulator [Caulobacteraceae bacterium]|nr:LysR family transcriptional regulator [Caulobacteraceae bacterium]
MIGRQRRVQRHSARQPGRYGLVRCVSFSLAAEALGCSKSTVSAHVTRLDQRIGARRLRRSTRSVSLTEAGRAYLCRIEDFMDRVRERGREGGPGADATEPRGVLRLVRLLSDRVIAAVPVLAVHPDNRQIAAEVRAFVDFLIRRLPAHMAARRQATPGIPMDEGAERALPPDVVDVKGSFVQSTTEARSRSPRRSLRLLRRTEPACRHLCSLGCVPLGQRRNPVSFSRERLNEIVLTCLNAKKPGTVSGTGLLEPVKMVAGAGFEPATFRL